MGDKIKILTLDEKALTRAASVFTETFKGPPWCEVWEVEDAYVKLKDFYNTPRSLGYLAVDATKDLAVGTLCGAFEVHQKSSFFMVREMCVLPDYQRQGIGALMLDALKKEVTSRGGIAILLLTACNSPAAQLYSSQGFAARTDMQVMSLMLQSPDVA